MEHDGIQAWGIGEGPPREEVVLYPQSLPRSEGLGDWGWACTCGQEELPTYRTKRIVRRKAVEHLGTHGRLGEAHRIIPTDNR